MPGLLTKAIAFAQEKHAGQLDKQGKDYGFHLMRVLGIAHDYDPEDPIMHTAAVLHDVVEDQPVTLADIQTEFGVPVAQVVSLVSHIHGRTYHEQIQAIVDAEGEAGRRARLVKAADLQDHLDTIHLLAPKDRGLEKRYLKAARQLGLHVQFKLLVL